MSIEWYPGHMVTARKDAAVAMRATDVIIEVLDARVPHASANPLVEKMRREHHRQSLKILNKSDLADPAATEAWIANYEATPGVRAIALSAKKSGEVQRIVKECEAMVEGRGTNAKPLRLLILGIPNVGKSTLMNTLLKRAISKVGNEPAITKSHLRHSLSPGVWLTDTPGMLWPGVPQNAALKLAATNSIGKNAYDEEEVAAALGELLIARYAPLLEKRYGASAASGHALLEKIATRRSYVRKGGVLDLAKAANALLNDFRDGTLGRISLDAPPP